MTFIVEPISFQDNIFIFPLTENDFSNDFGEYGLDMLCAAENHHFWFLARNEIILSWCEKFIRRDGLFLEAGAGNGNVAHYLTKAGYNIAAGDIYLSGLQQARKCGVKTCYLFDLYHPPFVDHFDAIGMFDVLEHLEDETAVLNNCRTMLKKEGRMIMTVPAFNFLWSREDAYGHKRRYDKAGLIKKVTSSGFHILHCSYIFSFITPLLVLRTILHPDDGSPITQAEINAYDIQILPLINTLLLKLCRLENKFSGWTEKLPGGSLMIVAQKK